MRVAIDARALNTRHLRGMGKALFNLLRESAREADLSFHLLADEPRAPLHVPDRAAATRRVWEVKGHRFRAWERVGLPLAAWRAGCDLLHCPGTDAPAWQPVPTVVTVHDTLPWREEPASRRLARQLPRAYRRARAIITPSRSSAGDIAAMWPDLESRLAVIPWGVDDRYLAARPGSVPPALAEQGVRAPYLLYFGGVVERKRLDWAVRVWSAVAGTDLALVVCGLEADARAAWRARVDAALRDRFVCLPFVAEDDLPALYASASAVLYPSLYEGFGFPALEAQAVGTSVLMSAVGSLAELAGPGAVVLPPGDLEAWTAAVRRLRTGERTSSDAARRWAATYTWAAAFARTLDVYRTALAR